MTKVLARTIIVCAALAAALLLFAARPASAQTAPTPPTTAVPPATELPRTVSPPPADQGPASVTVEVPNPSQPGNALTLLIGLTALSLAPSGLILLTGFTRIVVVLSMARNAIGLQATPPNQVIVGLALFITIFVMAPVFRQVNDAGVQPYLKGSMPAAQAFDAGSKPMKKWMLAQTRDAELKLFLDAGHSVKPKDPQTIPLTTIIPAFVLSELKTAFILGFLIYLPFLVVDLVVSAVLMSLGMMMLPPTMVALPFKILLFIMANGWVLVVTTLITSFRTG